MPLRPRLALIATGGTIAGVGDLACYQAGALPASSLLDAVPGLATLADWQVEQPFSLDSRDITPAHWVQLARDIETLRSDPAIAGVVITHGTDTLEETAYALSLLLPPGKSVVLTAAMRPATSLSADGPLNFLQAAQVAAHPASAGRNVLFVGNDRIVSGTRVIKAHTHAPDALRAQEGGDLGYITGQKVVFIQPRAESSAAPLPIPDAAFPRVDVVFVTAGQDPDLIDWSIQQGAKGIVLALPGHGSVPAAFLPALRNAGIQGITIIRASRVSHGAVSCNHNAEDDANGWIAAGLRNPQQAKVLLLLALAAGHDTGAIADLFHRTPF